MQKQYICKYCGKRFNSRKNQYKHENIQKACCSREWMVNAAKKIGTAENMIEYYKRKLDEYEKENKTLKTIFEIHEMKKDVDEIKQRIQDYVPPPLKNNQIVVLNDRNNVTLGFNLKPLCRDSLKHITSDMLLRILDNDKFKDSLGTMTTAVYFHPQAPENMTWLVRDIKSEYGAMEYDFGTGLVVDTITDNTIEKNISEMIFRVTDLITQLEKSSDLTQNQTNNSLEFINLVGNPITQDLVSHIKKVAYQRRNSTKSLWKFLEIRHVPRCGGNETSKNAAGVKDRIIDLECESIRYA